MKIKLNSTVVILFCLALLSLNAVGQSKKTVYIQPLGEVSPKVISLIKAEVEKFYGYSCIVLPKVDFTNDILAPSKTRYDASKILNKYNSTKNLLIITEKDIAHKRGSNPEWGIFGLGYRPGTTCVISTFRLKRNVSESVFQDRLIKVCLHEIGHNLGLDHCTNHIKCMMNDARGTISQVDQEKIWFCDKCRSAIGR